MLPYNSIHIQCCFFFVLVIEKERKTELQVTKVIKKKIIEVYFKEVLLFIIYALIMVDMSRVS